MYPRYQDLDITQYPTSWGFYTLGFILRHRPDIELIPLRFKNFNESIEPHDRVNYDWLRPKIENALSQGKIVGLLPEDEHVTFTVNTQLTNIVNQFADRPVYWLTQCDRLAQRRIYYDFHGMQCRMIEVPWTLLNDCLTYYRVRSAVEKNTDTHTKFLCMVNKQDSHKMELISAIHEARLSDHGKITLVEPAPGFEYCEINKFYPYSNVPPDCSAIGACHLIKGVWVSKNVENYLYIEKTYNHIPLIINPETTVLQFMSTEKSIWPALLGHVFLIWGRPGTMAWIQKFYDVDIESFADIAYDRLRTPVRETYDDSDRRARSLKYLLRANRNLIVNATNVKQKLGAALEAARWTFGRNMYNFFIDQLRQVV